MKHVFTTFFIVLGIALISVAANKHIKYQKKQIIKKELIKQQNTTNSDADPTAEIIPPSPTAAGLGKFGEIPVSYHTGVPNISIPIYGVQSGDIGVPISLDYHAGGIKVSDLASPVGLGFNLQAGGVISRTVRGLPDEQIGAGFIDPSNPIKDLSNLTSTNFTMNDLGYFTDVQTGTKDLEPDQFSYNFLGYSGQFMFDKTGNINTIPYSDVKIEFEQNHTFKITTPDGVIYRFEDTEITHANYKPQALHQNGVFHFFGIPTYNNSIDPITSWYLSSITSLTGDVINFEYDTWSVNYYMAQSQSQNLTFHHYGNGSYTENINVIPQGSSFSVNAQRLKKIDYRDGKIKFLYSGIGNPRIDRPDDKSLETIEVYGKDKATIIKSFDLLYDYFTTPTAIADPTAKYNNRLRLTAVEEKSTAGSSLIKSPYEITYTSNNLPSVYSNAQDYWGYYNGKIRMLIYYLL